MMPEVSDPKNKNGSWSVDGDFEFEETPSCLLFRDKFVQGNQVRLGQTLVLLSFFAHIFFHDRTVISYGGCLWVFFFHQL